jgi:hypothetical protein
MGSDHLLKREFTIVYTKYSPLSKYRGFDFYSMNKAGDRKKMFVLNFDFELGVALYQKS